MSIRRIALFNLAVLIALTGCFVGALFFERRSVEKSVQNYISIWEDEIVQSLITQQDKNLLEKIVSQLRFVSSPIENTKISLLSDSFQIDGSYSLQRFQIPLAVNYMTAGLVEVRLDQKKMIVAALFSPIFLVAFLLIIGAAVLIWLREQRSIFDKRAMQLKIQQQSEIAQLARQVAHDIRGPLSALKAIASKPEALSTSYREFFVQGTDRISQVATDLLEISRNDSRIAVKELHLDQLVSVDKVMKVLNDEFAIQLPSVQWNFQTQGNGKKIAISLPEAKLSRILANVLQNSAEAQAKKVDVSFVEKQREVVFSVQDNGVGIPVTVLPQLFSEEISFGKENGNGIGLKTAKEDLEKIGGQITLSSKENMGTLVQIRIPLSL